MDNELSDIMKTVDELAYKLQNSEVYNNYLALKAKVLRDPETKHSIARFKRVQFEYESKVLRHIEPDFSEEQYLSKLYSDLTLREDIKIFLETEKDVLKIIKEVNGKVLDIMKINMSFLN